MKLGEHAAQGRLLRGLAEAFGLERTPRRIEVYDNSHIHGTNAVGAMIVSGPDGLVKSQYRKFNIDSHALTAGDDFGMMKEVMTRRFTRLLKEDRARQTDTWPDLLLIDGGAGHIGAVAQTLHDMGVDDVPCLGVAKGVDRNAGKEMFHRPGHKHPIALRQDDPVLYFIQRLRDEAHRFAIGAHRARRARSLMENPLDQVPGIGPTRKRALLAHFGSAKAVTRAGLDDLKAAEGINDKLAETIHDFFHSQG